MGNIVVLIIFFIFRAIIGRLLQSQKTQTPTMPKKPDKGKRYSLPPIQDFRSKTTPIKESKTTEIKPDTLCIPVEEKYLHKTISNDYVESKHHQLQPESDGEIHEFFTQEDILRGIILKEVLSPPKALVHRRY
jgi:hypothetical protein